MTATIDLTGISLARLMVVAGVGAVAVVVAWLPALGSRHAVTEPPDADRSTA